MATPRRHAPCLLLESLSPASSLQPLGELLLQFWWLTTHLRMLEATVRRKSSERTPRPRPRACAGDGNSASASHSLPGHPTACGGLTPASEPSGGQALPHCPHPPPPHSSSLLCGGESHPPQDLHPSCASTLPTGPAAESTHPVSCPSPAPLLHPQGHGLWAPSPPLPAPVSSALHRGILLEEPSADSTGNLPITRAPPDLSGHVVSHRSNCGWLGALLYPPAQRQLRVPQTQAWSQAASEHLSHARGSSQGRLASMRGLGGEAAPHPK